VRIEIGKKSLGESFPRLIGCESDQTLSDDPKSGGLRSSSVRDAVDQALRAQEGCPGKRLAQLVFLLKLFDQEDSVSRLKYVLQATKTLEGIGVQGLRKEDSHCIPIRGGIDGLMEATSHPVHRLVVIVYRRPGPLGG